MWWCSSYLIKSVIQARCHAKHLLSPHRCTKSGHYKAQQCPPHLSPLDTNFPSLHASSQSPSRIYKHAASITPAMPLPTCMYYGFFKYPTEHLRENSQLCCSAEGVSSGRTERWDTAMHSFPPSFYSTFTKNPPFTKDTFKAPGVAIFALSPYQGGNREHTHMIWHNRFPQA